MDTKTLKQTRPLFCPATYYHPVTIRPEEEVKMSSTRVRTCTENSTHLCVMCHKSRKNVFSISRTPLSNIQWLMKVCWKWRMCLWGRIPEELLEIPLNRVGTLWAAATVGNDVAKMLWGAKKCAYEHKPSKCHISENMAMCNTLEGTCITKAIGHYVSHSTTSLSEYRGPCVSGMAGPLCSLNHHSTPVKFSLPAATQNPYMLSITCHTLGAWLDSAPKVPAIIMATGHPKQRQKTKCPFHPITKIAKLHAQ